VAKKVTLNLTDKEFELLAALAELRGRTKTDVMREGLGLINILDREHEGATIVLEQDGERTKLVRV
jgi:hypothetical protein